MRLRFSALRPHQLGACRHGADNIKEEFTKNCPGFDPPNLPPADYLQSREARGPYAGLASSVRGVIMHSSVESSVRELQRRATLCRRLSEGAVPLKVAQQLTAFARDYDKEARRLQRERQAA